MRPGGVLQHVEHLQADEHAQRTRRPCAFLASALMHNLASDSRSRPFTSKRGWRSSNRTFDLVLINSSGRPQLMAALQISLGVAVFLCQQHHPSGSAFTDLQHEAKQVGWTAEGALACTTAKDGSSAGVAVVAKKGMLQHGCMLAPTLALS